MKYTLTIIYIAIISVFSFGQDPIYSQFNNSPLQLNPAFAGSNFDGRLAVNYRLQWPGLSAAYNTFSIGYDQYFQNSNLSLGINLLSDRAGDGALSHRKVSGIVGYKLKLDDEIYIKGGIELGYTNKSLVWQKLLFYDAIAANGGITPGGGILPSKEVEPGNTSRNYLDIGSGLLLISENFYIGIAGEHLNTPLDNFLNEERQNYIGLPIRWSIHGGYKLSLPTKGKNLPSYISPNFLFSRQANFNQFHFGVNGAINGFMGGLGYRISGITGDAVIINAGIRTANFKIGYSFDFTTSSLTIAQGGAHEVSVLYSFGSKQKSKINDCSLLFD